MPPPGKQTAAWPAPASPTRRAATVGRRAGPARWPATAAERGGRGRGLPTPPPPSAVWQPSTASLTPHPPRSLCARPRQRPRQRHAARTPRSPPNRQTPRHGRRGLPVARRPRCTPRPVGRRAWPPPGPPPPATPTPRRAAPPPPRRRRTAHAQRPAVQRRGADQAHPRRAAAAAPQRPAGTHAGRHARPPIPPPRPTVYCAAGREVTGGGAPWRARRQLEPLPQRRQRRRVVATRRVGGGAKKFSGRRRRKTPRGDARGGRSPARSAWLGARQSPPPPPTPLQPTPPPYPPP